MNVEYDMVSTFTTSGKHGQKQMSSMSFRRMIESFVGCLEARRGTKYLYATNSCGLCGSVWRSKVGMRCTNAERDFEETT